MATHSALVEYRHLEGLDFWARVAVGAPQDCWEWTKGRNARGYGIVHVSPKLTGLDRNVTLYAHRVALTLHAGRMLGAQLVVDHRCHNLACCNPAHLEEVTTLQNVRRCRKELKPVRHETVAGVPYWLVRYYDYTGPKRRYLSRRHETEAAALADVAAMKTDWQR